MNNVNKRWIASFNIKISQRNAMSSFGENFKNNTEGLFRTAYRHNSANVIQVIPLEKNVKFRPLR